MDRLAVDNTSGDDKTAVVVEKLERMVELGLEAERAMRDIRTKGYAEGFFPIVDGENDGTVGYGGHASRAKADVVFHQLQKYVEPVRDLGPPLSDLQILLEGYEDGPSGTVFKQCTLFLQGTMFRQTDKPGRTHIMHQRKIPFGHLRFLKSGYSIQVCAPQPEKDHLIGSGGDVVQLYTAFQYKGAAESAQRLAAGMAVAIVRTQHGILEDQLTCDMRAQVEKWLVEEKHVERMCVAVKEIARVHEVMHA